MCSTGIYHWMCGSWFEMLYYCFFFFKQKTAYEMRISDWSSDVCSSDLLKRRRGPTIFLANRRPFSLASVVRRQENRDPHRRFAVAAHKIGRASCRERVCQYV